MSLFQHVSMWSLRALALWGAVELAAATYNGSAEAAAAFNQLTRHRAAMSRLDERASQLERHAATLEARASAASPVIATDGVTASTIQSTLRETLMALGAQAPVVDVEPNASPSAKINLTAEWREPRETAPQALAGLAQRFPGLTVTMLSLERHDALVHVSARFSASLASPPRVSP